MRTRIDVISAECGKAVVSINNSVYDIDYSNDRIPFTAFKNGRCVSGVVESQWIYTKTNGVVGSAAFRMMLEQHERAAETRHDRYVDKLSNMIKSGGLSESLWPLLYPKNYCLSYAASSGSDKTVCRLMLLRSDCDDELRSIILENTGVHSTSTDLRQLLNQLFN